MSKNKQVSNKPVPHKSEKAAEKVRTENDSLHATFYAVNKKALYEKDGFLIRGSVARPAKSTSNGALAKQWNCTERHVSKVNSGRGTPACKPDCNCPITQKAAKATAAPATT